METSQPLVTFVIPCYNAAEYLDRSVGSICAAQGDFEVLIVDDGSKDDSLAVARRLAEEDPRVRVAPQANANWGGVVNHALKLAAGRYFKVVDADDHLDSQALEQALQGLQAAVDAGEAPDLMVTNYVYDRVSDQSRHAIRYRGLFPEGRTARWDELGRPGLDQIIMVHATWYRTEVLRESGLVLPEGISYTDGLFVLLPMARVRTVLYLDLDVYYYLIGREGQSVDVEVVKRNIDQQLEVTRLAIARAGYGEVAAREPKQAELMMRYIVCMMSVNTIYLAMIGTPEAEAKNAAIWELLRETDPALYQKVRRSKAGLADRRHPWSRRFAVWVYTLIQNIFKFA